MPDFRCECQGADGGAVVRVLAAESAQAAVEVLRGEGLKVLRVQRMAAPRVQAEAGPAQPVFSVPVSRRHRAPDWRWAHDFFRFRLLLTPPIVQVMFGLATAACVIGLVVLPIQYAEDVRAHAAEVAPEKGRIRSLRAYIGKAEALERQAVEADLEAAQFAGRPDFTIAHAQAKSKAERIREQIRSSSPESGVTSIGQAQQAIAMKEERIRQHLAKGPKVLQLLLNLGWLILGWVWIRVVLEFLVILFSIHDRLCEMAPRGRG